MATKTKTAKKTKVVNSLQEETVAGKAVQTPLQPERYVTVHYSYQWAGCWVIQIANGTTAEYLILKLADGLYEITKLEPARRTTYTVNLNVLGTGNGCSCEGWKHHRKCKHADALRSLEQKGRLG